jgi:hypothetical protein
MIFKKLRIRFDWDEIKTKIRAGLKFMVLDKKPAR